LRPFFAEAANGLVNGAHAFAEAFAQRGHFGSNCPQKIGIGKPPHSSFHIALWPAAQTPTVSFSGCCVPESMAGIQSAHSTQYARPQKRWHQHEGSAEFWRENHSLE
jgi:hypothetical protein